MFDEKNIYVKQAEVKGCIKQNNNGVFLLSELTVNSSLKNYKHVLREAFSITIDEINSRNDELARKEKTVVAKKDKKANVKGME
jgi:hypothetical protein